ncbi:MAG TPA: thiamine pyrophosphate-binding protein [Candidatus Binatia bacterium]|jgi:benzoylformate decarboxylase|nr:thiamine pyrophosphate-binding protein [Candidatus Binatia bacterium]
MPQQKIASQAYLEVAAAHGIDYVFGLPGTSGQEFIGTIADQEKIRFVLAMHETCVVSMADGHARVTGRPQLAQVSTLPGSANAIGALYDAYRDRSPVIVTSTNVDTRIVGRDSHTEGKDLVEMTKQFTKWSAEVHRSDRIPEYLNRAFKVASTPPTGPVYLALPSNLLGETISIANPNADRSRIVARIAGDPEALAEAAKLLAQAKRPVIVAGSGVAKGGAIEELIKFAEMVAAPVVMEPRYSFLAFPTTHPQSFQIAERQPSFDLPVWGEPDLIFAIGCRLIREYRYLPEPVIKADTRSIHIEEDPWEIGKVFPVDVGIIADAKSALKSLIEIYPKFATTSDGKAKRLECIRKAKEQVNAELENRVKQGWDSTPINAARLARTMDRLIEKDALIVNESPTSKDILMANFQFSPGRSYFSNSSGGFLGWGLGAAIGAKLASPKRRVVACLGDGSCMFGIQGLWTLAKYRVPLVVIVFNNRAYMAVKNQFRGSEERIRIAAEMGAEITGPDINFARLADTFGIFGQRVEQPDAIEPALKRALEHSGPALVDVVICQNTRKD